MMNADSPGEAWSQGNERSKFQNKFCYLGFVVNFEAII